MTAKDKVCPAMKVAGENAGSQLIASIVSAPSIGYTPFISLVALKFLSAKGGAVMVAGA
jgi:hypothetical protein